MLWYPDTQYPGCFHNLTCFFIVVLRPTIRHLQSILRSTCHGCNNHDIVIGLCSKLLMRFSYYIHRIYVLEFFLTLVGFEPGHSRTEVGYSNHSTKALTLISGNFISGHFHIRILSLTQYSKSGNWGTTVVSQYETRKCYFELIFFFKSSYALACDCSKLHNVET